MSNLNGSKCLLNKDVKKQGTITFKITLQAGDINVKSILKLCYEISQESKILTELFTNPESFNT